VDGEAWGNVITAVVTAAATLLGVWLTQRHAAAMRQHDRNEQRRVEQRTALAEVLVTGREWAESLDAVTLMSAVSGDSTVAGLSSAMDRYQALERTHLRAPVAARLVVRDHHVGSRLVALSNEAAELPILFIDWRRAVDRS
jgi:hypothetical protein